MALLADATAAAAPRRRLPRGFADPHLEAEFRRGFRRRSIRLVRSALVAAAALYVLFGLLDLAVVPEAAAAILPVRVAGSLLLVAAFAATFVPALERHHDRLLEAVVLGASAGIVAIILLSESAGGYLYYAGLILAVMFAHGPLRLRFLPATWTTWTVILAYAVLAAGLGVTPPTLVLNNVAFLVAANLVGMVASHGFEAGVRRELLQTRVVERQHDELEREHERKSRELEAARRIQLALLPQRLPEHPEVELSVAMRTAAEIGGDFYDFHQGPDGALTVALGDATGHGAQAGALVTATKLLFTELGGGPDVAALLERSSAALRAMGLPRLFMALGVCRLRDGRLEAAGAGIPPGLLLRAATGSVEEVSLAGAPLGSIPGFRYRRRTLPVEPGDTLLLMTDGLPELAGPDGELLGYERIRRHFDEAAGLPPEELVRSFEELAAHWLGGRPPGDDVTLLALRVRGRAGEVRQLQRDGEPPRPPLGRG